MTSSVLIVSVLTSSTQATAVEDSDNDNDSIADDQDIDDDDGGFIDKFELKKYRQDYDNDGTDDADGIVFDTTEYNTHLYFNTSIAEDDFAAAYGSGGVFEFELVGFYSDPNCEPDFKGIFLETPCGPVISNGTIAGEFVDGTHYDEDIRLVDRSRASTQWRSFKPVVRPFLGVVDQTALTRTPVSIPIQTICYDKLYDQTSRYVSTDTLIFMSCMVLTKTTNI